MAGGLGSLQAGWKEAEERKGQKSSKSSKKLLDRKETAGYNEQVAEKVAVQKTDCSLKTKQCRKESCNMIKARC